SMPEEPLARLEAGAPRAVHLVLFDHGRGIVAAEPDVLPDAEEVDGRGILEALAGLHDRAQRPRLLAVDEPGVVLATCRSFDALHPRPAGGGAGRGDEDRKSTRLNSSH